MKTKTLLVRTAAVSALLALQACNQSQTDRSEHDPHNIYKLGSIYDCDQVARPDVRLNHEQTPSAGFGCAHLSNITAMVVDPADLQQARPMTPADPRARDRVYEAYRKGEDTSTAKDAKGTSGLIE